jgi:hypothetical protein
MLGRLRCAGLVEFGGLAAAESNKPFQLLEKKSEGTISGVNLQSYQTLDGA